MTLPDWIREPDRCRDADRGGPPDPRDQADVRPGAGGHEPRFRRDLCGGRRAVDSVGDLAESRPNNPTAALIAQGTDALRIMANFARSHHLEIFWSLRINNTHDNISIAHRVAAGENKVPDIFSKFKREHPELLMGKKADNAWRPAAPLPVRGSWTAVDFGDERVRQMTIDLIEEVCRNYPVHGVEIDFDRFPVLLEASRRVE